MTGVLCFGHGVLHVLCPTYRTYRAVRVGLTESDGLWLRVRVSYVRLVHGLCQPRFAKQVVSLALSLIHI